MYNKYLMHLDDLRKARKVKISDFCDGVCSDRTYRRYLSGERVPSQKVINELSSRLGLTIGELYSIVDADNKSIFEKLGEIHISAVTGELEEAKKRLTEIILVTIENETTRKYYQFLQVLIQYKLNQITKIYTYDILNRLIDHNVVYNLSINYVDLYILLLIAEIEQLLEKDSSKTTDFLTNIVLNKNQNSIFTANEKHFIHMIVILCQIHGMKNSYSTIKELSTVGINKSLSINYNMYLTKLYYYLALSNYRLGNTVLSNNYALKSLSNLISNDNLKNFNYYNKMFKDILGKTFAELSADFEKTR